MTAWRDVEPGPGEWDGAANPESDELIAVFIRTLHDAGGAQRAMVRYASGLAERGYRVDIITLRAGGYFASELHPSIRTVEIAGGRLAKAIPAIAGYLRRQRPAVLFSTEPACNISVILGKLLSRVPTRVVVREGLFPSVAKKKDPYISTKLAYALAPWLYRRADGIVAIAREMTDDLANVAKISPARITTIPVNPVVTDDLLAKARMPVDHPWFGDGEPPVILGVGRLSKQKDFLTLLRAFNLVRDTMPCRLMIIGEGGERRTLESAVRQSPFADEIALLGFIQEPYAHMARCGVFVLSSEFEGLPNVLIEAVACGAPAVSTRCPSGPSDVLQDGAYGALVPVGDPVRMAAAIAETLRHPPDRRRQALRGQDFTVERSLERYLPILMPHRYPAHPAGGAAR